MPTDPLQAFTEPVRSWFRSAFGEPTPPQAQGWPSIQRGENTLILSPTGSGKTLAAFLCGIDEIYARLAGGDVTTGVQLLYVSPLKALNNDIERNLRAPLAGIRRMADDMGQPLPSLKVALRTGDTPQSARTAMVQRPPHILITTPESLYLILTSPRAREILATVRSVILDEIHTLCGNKRGTHLALTLERLEAMVGRPLQRIGLSATQRPLEEVALFLGGYAPKRAGSGSHEEQMAPRPVTIVDAGTRKPLDLGVTMPVASFRQAPGGSIWSSIIPQVLEQVRQHRTTLVFANSRRQAERCADRLNDQYAAESEGLVERGSVEALSPGGVPTGIGMMGTGAAEGPFRAHHGSVSRTVRLQLERDLKEGKLPALIGTSSLELGIDIGAVDLVVQLQSPRGIARGLQRVGRSGHLVGQTSVGRIYPTHSEDLLEAAAVAHGMLDGDVEPTYAPQNCLDVLAQQIVAMVSVRDWDVSELYSLVRRAYGYHGLTFGLYRAVLDMISGKYPSATFRELRPRIVWDRVHDCLTALPGSRLLALRNGGTIPDRGTFGVYLADRETRIGDLDEEFVFETRPGDVFTLGTQMWRVTDIDEDRMVVAEASEGQIPRMPFWRGDLPHRSYHLGIRLGEFRRLLAQKVAVLPSVDDESGAGWPDQADEAVDWLGQEYALDELAARSAITYVQRQMQSLGAISSDRTIILETFTDAIGDLRLVIHTCFGGRVNSAWALALSNAFRQRMETAVEVQSSDDGILFRFPESDRDPPLDLVASMGPSEVRERLLAELPSSALFGAHFRMNAARALLLPSIRGGNRRTPFWLQRLRAKDLLAAAISFDDFPIVAETYRDCLRDVLDLSHLEEILNSIQMGDIRIVRAETIAPSPVAASLLFNFASFYMYEWDEPQIERKMQSLMLSRSLLAELIGEDALADLIRPDAIQEVEELLSNVAEGYQARTVEELAVIIGQAGDLTTNEVQARAVQEGQGWIEDLSMTGRVLTIALPAGDFWVGRWVAAENYALYREAFGLPDEPTAPVPQHLLSYHSTPDEARLDVLRRYLRQRGPRTRDEILVRYTFPAGWLDKALADLVESGEVVSGRFLKEADLQFCDRHVLERIHRITLVKMRREIQPVPIHAYADFLLRWHHLHPDERLAGRTAIVDVLRQLRGIAVPGVVWERDLLPGRVADFAPSGLASMCASGELVWVVSGRDPRRSHVRFIYRGEGHLFLAPPSDETMSGLSEEARAALRVLEEEGACFTTDVQQMARLDTEAAGEALVELVLAGLVTNDSLATLRRILVHRLADEIQREPLSALEAELSAWRRARPPAQRSRPTPGRYGHAKRQAARRTRGIHPWAGRWSLVYRRGVLGDEISPETRAVQQARQLLARHGIVTRASLEREEGPWVWAEISRQLMLMEMRGEVRRGYFVEGLPGIQYAVPDAVDKLRAWSANMDKDAASQVLINACDPASLYTAGMGIAAGGAPGSAQTDELFRLAQLPGNYLVLSRGRPVMGIANGGERILADSDLGDQSAAEALKLFLERVTSGDDYRMVISEWNGEPVLASPMQQVLASLGFRREPPRMVWEREY